MNEEFECFIRTGINVQVQYSSRKIILTPNPMATLMGKGCDMDTAIKSYEEEGFKITYREGNHKVIMEK